MKNRCTHKQKDGAVFRCTHPKLHSIADVITPRVCKRCPWHDGGSRTTEPRVLVPLEQIPATSLPSPVKVLSNFAAAYLRWRRAGKPTRTDEQVAALYSICETCDKFNGSSCTVCGCLVSKKRQYLNKLRWATEACPVGKWSADVPGEQSQSHMIAQDERGGVDATTESRSGSGR